MDRRCRSCRQVQCLTRFLPVTDTYDDAGRLFVEGRKGSLLFLVVVVRRDCGDTFCIRYTEKTCLPHSTNESPTEGDREPKPNYSVVHKPAQATSCYNI